MRKSTVAVMAVWLLVVGCKGKNEPIQAMPIQLEYCKGWVVRGWSEHVILSPECEMMLQEGIKNAKGKGALRPINTNSPVRSSSGWTTVDR